MTARILTDMGGVECRATVEQTGEQVGDGVGHDGLLKREGAHFIADKLNGNGTISLGHPAGLWFDMVGMLPD